MLTEMESYVTMEINEQKINFFFKSQHANRWNQTQQKIVALITYPENSDHVTVYLYAYYPT